jgi:hypothetical protein
MNNTSGAWLLACGLACIALGAGLLLFTMIGLLGIGLLLVALGLVVAGAISIRGADVPWLRAFAGLVLVLVAFILFVGSAAQTCMLSYRPQSNVVGPLDLLVVGIGTMLGALVLGFALRLRTSWSSRRVLVWSFGSLLISPIALLIFNCMAQLWPMGA